MADTNQPTTSPGPATTTSASIVPASESAPVHGEREVRGARGRSRPRRGRGGAAGVPAEGSTQGTNQDNQRGPRREGRGGRGRGRGRNDNQGRGGGNNQASDNHTSIFNRPLQAREKKRSGRHGDLEFASSSSDEEKTDEIKPAPVQQEDDEDICFICANPIIYHSVAPCNHRTCHICSLRMRALYKTKQCPHCRTNSDFVIFTVDPEKPYQEYVASNIVSQDDSLGIKYDQKRIREDTTLLLRYNCPDPTCDVACLGWPSLHKHVKEAHQRFLCDLCSRFKKVFTHEHLLYTERDLRRHERHGDDQPGTTDQSGFKGHPECEFCRRRFYGSDELFQHCKEAHERCFLCDRLEPNRARYFQNYDTLEAHFRTDHFLCPASECMDKKFVVFASELDLKAHQVEEHPNGLSKNALKEARRIDMSHFTEAHQSSSRGRGRGGRMPRDHRHDPQAPDPPPPPRDGPMRRDELAYQRTLAVQSAQSLTRRDFGGQLTVQGPAFAAPPVPPAEVPQAMTVSNVQHHGPGNQPENFPSLAPLSLRDQPTPIPRTGPTSNSRPVSSSNLLATSDQARKAKHAAVIERASFLLRQDSKKIETFANYIGQYRVSSITGMDLIDAFWSLFDIKSVDLGTLVRELAELFETEAKKTELLKAWNSWRATNEDYPPMAGASTSAAQATIENGTTKTARILNIKSATTKNLRGGRTGSSPWANMNSTIISNPSGSLAGVGSANRAPNRKAAVKATPWAGAAGARPTTAAKIPHVGSSTASGAGTTPATSTREFPALPPKMTNYAPVPRKHEGVAPASVWSGGSGGGGNSGAYEDNFDSGNEGNESSAKKKGKKKQVLFHYG